MSMNNWVYYILIIMLLPSTSSVMEYTAYNLHKLAIIKI